ncbi:hypothetical protein KMZ93_02335 [Bradyrhizobium sediminis]|uniref:Uncharacterized protein n=1 Tax=Bradyrhizobium sediminis TaxID=2840469 RepID=A0A975NYK8_9BRAD|nr:hypothetical protein [Bradyrhizobium sediminis]QWG23807.1 hypothetical protein KMZ93_02335 [Bradyrhizobium sediminis]
MFGVVVVAAAIWTLYALSSKEPSFHGALVRKAIINGQPVHQDIGHAISPYTQVLFNEVVYDTVGGLWDGYDHSFAIPEGFSKARFSIQAVFQYNPEGMRQILVQRKSPPVNSVTNPWTFFTGQPIQNARAIEFTTTDLSATGPFVPVMAGERYAFMVYQTSGMGVHVSGGSGTYFAIELIR